MKSAPGVLPRSTPEKIKNNTEKSGQIFLRNMIVASLAVTYVDFRRFPKINGKIKGNNGNKIRESEPRP